MASLSQEIEFHEKFRGYDPDEVDAYIDRVRRTAALAMGRISELHERVEASESLVASSRTNSAEETLGRALILAQETADSVVANAEADAARLVTEATEQADASLSAANEQSSRVLAEAETDRREIIRTAEADARSFAAEARDLLQDDVSGLGVTRDYLEDDIAILEKHVREQRANLSLVVSSLTDLIEQPQSFRLEPAPATSGVDSAPQEMVDPVEQEEPNLDDDAELSLDDDEPAVDASPEPIEPPRLTTSADLDDQSESPDSHPELPRSVDNQQPTLAVPLFGDETPGDRPAKVIQHVVGLSEGDMLADNDDALSAFFDQDDDPDRSWFGPRS